MKESLLENGKAKRKRVMWYNLSVGLTPASSPGRGALGKEVKFTGCQSLSYKERCHRR